MMKMKIFFGVVLLHFLQIFDQSESTCNPCDGCDACQEENYLCYSKDGITAQCVNPCENVRCAYQCRTIHGCCGNYSCPPVAICSTPCEYTRCPAGSLCYFNTTKQAASCVNACAYSTCGVGTTCVTVPGKCGTYFCPPQVKCIPSSPPPSNPPSSCVGVSCPPDQKCTVVKTLQYESVAICGENPCIKQQDRCCRVRYSNGEICNNVTCYLNFKKGSCIPGRGCQVEPECKDPCRVEKIDCSDNPGQYCYPEVVECFVAPCPPIPMCREPCSPKVNVCLINQKCDIIDVDCISDKKNKNWDPYCKPQEVCKYIGNGK